MKLEDCVINKQKTCFVAIGKLQIIIIRGLQSGFPWTQLRRRYVSYFFPNTPQLIPDSQPFVNPHSMPTIPVEQLKKIFHVDELGQKQLIPGYTAIKEMSKPMISKFISLFKPNNTFSGFRIDLVRAIKVMTFILFKGRTDLQGL